jgi:methylmalonyl-CoA mutase N-terminal domain/subunit
VIGVNKYVMQDEKFDIELHPYDQSTATRQIDRLNRVRAERDNAKVTALLDKLVAVAKDPAQNIMPVTIELVRGRRPMGDIVEKLKTIWGTYREKPGVLGATGAAAQAPARSTPHRAPLLQSRLELIDAAVR